MFATARSVAAAFFVAALVALSGCAGLDSAGSGPAAEAPPIGSATAGSIARRTAS